MKTILKKKSQKAKSVKSFRKMSEREVMERLFKEARQEYPPFTKEELEKLPFECVGSGSNGSISLLTNWGSIIHICMGELVPKSQIIMTNPSDNEKFDNEFLKRTAMRFICSGFNCEIPRIYYCLKYLKPDAETREERDLEMSR